MLSTIEIISLIKVIKKKFKILWKYILKLKFLKINKNNNKLKNNKIKKKSFVGIQVQIALKIKLIIKYSLNNI